MFICLKFFESTRKLFTINFEGGAPLSALKFLEVQMNGTRAISALVLAALLVCFAAPLQAQSALGPKDLGFAYAVDYGKWSANSTDSVAAGSAVVTISGNPRGSMVTPGGRTFYPFATNVPLFIEAAGGTAEVVTPSAVTCSQNGTSCSFSATFSYAHNGKFRISSGSYGICEAKRDILTIAAGGTVLVANGFGGSTSTITSATLAGACDATTVNILDVRAGAFQFYTSNGSVYAASTSPFNATAFGATAVTATGTNFIGVGMDQTTNHAFGNASIGADVDGASYDCLKTRSNNADARATTTIVTGDDLCSLRAFGADGTNYIETAGILFDSTGTIASTRVPSVIKMYTGTDAAPTVKTLALTIEADQDALFAGQVQSTAIRNSGTALAATVTAVAPAPSIATVTAPATNANSVHVSGVASAVGAQMVLAKTRDVAGGGAATTTVVTGDDIGMIRAYGADGTNYIESASITFDTTGTIGSTRVPGTIVFKTGTDAAPTVLTTALTIGADQSATFAGTIHGTTINRTAGALALTTTTSGNITLTPAAAATAAVAMGAARFELKQGATIDSAGASCTSGDCTLGGDGNFFIVSNTTTVDGFATAGWQAGSVIHIMTSGSVTFNDGGTVAGGYALMKLTGNLSMTADDILTLIYDGTSWVEAALSQN
jgi:hypothetical protein